ITSPAGGEYFDATAPDYVVEISDSGSPIDTMWYTIDGGANIEFTVNSMFANDSAGNTNNSYSFTLYKDVLAPRIIVNNPINQTYYNAPPPINITAYDPNLTNMYYMVGFTQIP
ncbi:unnamed protein product, partial [marine sediment metagenome]